MLLTVSRVGAVLELFTADAPEWGVTDAAAALESPRSTTHALLSSLAEIGMLRNSGQGRYRLGWRIASLNETLNSNSGLRELAADALRQFAREFRETINLAVWDRRKTLLVDKVVSEHPITVRGAPIGARLEPATTEFGRVLLAFDEGNQRGGPNISITQPGQSLEFNLDDIRAAGMAFDNGEFDPDRRCVAAPIRNEYDRTIAAVSVTAPASRFLPRSDELSAGIRATANQISRAIVEFAHRPEPVALFE